jgi:hypothetical protein
MLKIWGRVNVINVQKVVWAVGEPSGSALTLGLIDLKT